MRRLTGLSVAVLMALSGLAVSALAEDRAVRRDPNRRYDARDRQPRPSEQHYRNSDRYRDDHNRGYNRDYRNDGDRYRNHDRRYDGDRYCDRDRGRRYGQRGWSFGFRYDTRPDYGYGYRYYQPAYLCVRGHWAYDDDGYRLYWVNGRCANPYHDHSDYWYYGDDRD